MRPPHCLHLCTLCHQPNMSKEIHYKTLQEGTLQGGTSQNSLQFLWCWNIRKDVSTLRCRKDSATCQTGTTRTPVLQHHCQASSLLLVMNGTFNLPCSSCYNIKKMYFTALLEGQCDFPNWELQTTTRTPVLQQHCQVSSMLLVMNETFNLPCLSCYNVSKDVSTLHCRKGSGTFQIRIWMQQKEQQFYNTTVKLVVCCWLWMELLTYHVYHVKTSVKIYLHYVVTKTVWLFILGFEGNNKNTSSTHLDQVC